MVRLDAQHARRRFGGWISTATGWARKGDSSTLRCHYRIAEQREAIEAQRAALRLEDDEWFARNVKQVGYDWDRRVPDNWPDYLALYGFPHAKIAEAITRMLLNPKTTHPAEFCAAVLGAVFYGVVPENYSAYEACKKWERHSRLQYPPRRDSAHRARMPF